MNIYNALIYKKLYGGGGGGEIEVESLTATENKTYNAGEGKAYNPVVVAIPEPTLISKSITANGNYSASADNADGYSSVSVNVPLPSNAYLLQTIEHESIATFTDGTDNFVKSLEVAIEPVQSGSGDPSPTNIRPISGWDECKVTVADDVDNPTVEQEYTIDLDGTRYGGKVDVVNGVLTENKDLVDLGDLTWSYTNNTFYATLSADSYKYVENTWSKCSCYNYVGTVYAGTSDMQNKNDGSYALYYNPSHPTSRVIYVKDTRYTDVATFTTAIEGQKIVYELATPQTIQLTPTIIKSLQGDNNFFASTGEIEILQYWGKEVTS